MTDSTASVTIYSSRYCPYCTRAKSLLERKGVAFTTIDVDTDPAQRSIMIERTGRTSVPQIFIGDHHVGGSDELHALDRQSQLDALLAGTAE